MKVWYHSAKILLEDQIFQLRMGLQKGGLTVLWTHKVAFTRILRGKIFFQAKFSFSCLVKREIDIWFAAPSECINFLFDKMKVEEEETDWIVFVLYFNRGKNSFTPYKWKCGNVRFGSYDNRHYYPESVQERGAGASANLEDLEQCK